MGNFILTSMATLIHQFAIHFQDTLIDEKQILLDRLTLSQDELNNQLKAAHDLNETLQAELSSAQEKILDLTIASEKEKAERVTILLKNAELTQTEESLRQDLKQEHDEMEELLEQIKGLQRNVQVHEKNEKDLMLEIEGLNFKIQEKEALEKENQMLSEELAEKNKSIKVLNQRLMDLKKTLQEEIRDKDHDLKMTTDNNNNHPKMVLHSSNGSVTMDEISFKYLKHVIMKFVTCRESEARHLLKAVSTILMLSSEEERLLDEMYKWKMSWFFGGSKPDIGQWAA